MLTVWSVCWGDKYPDYYVQRLKASVEKHLSFEHEFKCVTDREIPGVECVRPIVDWPGWWGKLALFAPDFAADRNLFFDLDVVIVGSLDDIGAYASKELAAPANWAQSGHGGIQSSVMAWNGQLTLPFDLFNPKDAHWPPLNQAGIDWGDQEYITRLRDSRLIEWTPIEPSLVSSYKYHCRNGLPANTRVVVFHGDPKPSGVQELWFEW